MLMVQSNLFAQEVRTSRFNQLWLDTIVSIEIATSDGDTQPLGTGFLMESQNQNLILVTARHVIEPVSENQRSIKYFLSNQTGEDKIVADQNLQDAGFGTWYFSKDIDLALRFFAWPPDFSGTYIPVTADMPKDTLQAGAPSLVLGFPLGLRDSKQNNPIVRRGTVARVDPDNIIVDSFVFPGNSGGPVVYIPPVKLVDDTLSPYINQEKLIGIVSSFIPYKEKAISEKTGRARVIFEENTGLANVIPIAEVRSLMQQKLIKEFEAQLPKPRNTSD